MKGFLLIAAVLACVLSVFAQVELDEGVLVLNAANFDEAVNDKDLILVEFYAPWCGHCKNLAPHYAKAAAELEPLGIYLAKVNADTDDNRPLAQRFDVKGFPTLKVFRRGQPTEYEGGRTTETIVSYMKRQNQPAVTPLNNTEQVQALADGTDIAVVGFFEKEGSEDEVKFNAVANTLRTSYTFASVVAQPEVATAHGAQGAFSVVVFKPFDEKKNVLTTAELETLEKSIAKYAIPLVDEIGPQNYKTYVDSALPLAYVFVNPEDRETYVGKVREIADSHRGQINWVWIDAAKFMRHGQNLGLSGKTVPAFVIEDVTTGLHYVFDETKTVDTDNLKDFTTKFLAKEIEPTIKSEEVPTSNDGPVKVVVAKNFDAIVKDSTKNVLLEFYAPWCGHCKTLAPIWEELGTLYQGSEDVVIAKIDATANDVDPKLNVRGFPTIKFFGKDDKTPVDYEGNRSKDDFISFLSQKTGLPAPAGHVPNPAQEGSKDEL